MAIDYHGHCALPERDAQRRIDFLRRTRPDWFGGVFRLTDAGGLGPFGRDIALEFGIGAKCRFGLFLLNSDWVGECGGAVDYLYEVFGTAVLVVTHGMDTVVAPRQPYPPMAID